MYKLFSSLCLLLLSFGMAQSQDSTPMAERPDNTIRFTIGGELQAPFVLNLSGAGTALGGGTRFTLKIGGTVGTEESPTAAFSASLTAGINLATRISRLELGEAYITSYLGDVDLSMGNLLVNWGATDLFSVLNTINPQDLSSWDGASIAVPAIRAIWNLPADNRLEAILVPGFSPSTLPIGTVPIPTNLPSGVSIVGQDPVLDKQPSVGLENFQYGLRYTGGLALFDGGDFSLSYYGGPRHTPTVAVQLIPTAVPGQFTVQPVYSYDWIYVLGADTNLAIGEVVFRAEAAFTFTQDMDGTNPAIGNPSFEATAQTEFSIDKINYTVLLNAGWRRGDIGQNDNFGLNLGLLLSHELDSRLALSGAWVQSLIDFSGTVVPRLEYTLADGLKGQGALKIGYGESGSRLNPGGGIVGQISLGLKLSF